MLNEDLSELADSHDSLEQSFWKYEYLRRECGYDWGFNKSLEEWARFDWRDRRATIELLEDDLRRCRGMLSAVQLREAKQAESDRAAAVQAEADELAAILAADRGSW